jgi:2-iminobutanoate/2-iminopropanoate deaminase
MPKALITAADAAPSTLPFSPAVRAGDWLYLSGQGGFDAAGALAAGVVAQTEEALRNVGALLQAGGATFDDVVSCLVHLADLDDFRAFNDAYARHFGDGVKPTRTTVRADLVLGMRVELTVVAYTGP